MVKVIFLKACLGREAGDEVEYDLFNVDLEEWFGILDQPKGWVEIIPDAKPGTTEFGRLWELNYLFLYGYDRYA